MLSGEEQSNVQCRMGVILKIFSDIIFFLVLTTCKNWTWVYLWLNPQNTVPSARLSVYYNDILLLRLFVLYNI